ncbi:MAG TPA: hypothetical protein VK926_07505, partial [Gaiellaceae bacterium]|nr:hypothetical protein [Gaiellaceae bacterium]
LLAPLGLLPLVPLVVQPVRGAWRRAVQAALAVLSAALVAGIAGDDLPIAGEQAATLGITPRTSATGVADALWESLVLQPALLAGAVLAGVAAAVLPSARRLSRFGAAAVGLALVAGTMAASMGVVSVILCAVVWTIASAAAALRPS